MAPEHFKKRSTDDQNSLQKLLGGVFASLLTLAIAGSFTNYLDFVSDRKVLSDLVVKVKELEKKNEEQHKTMHDDVNLLKIDVVNLRITIAKKYRYGSE